MRATRPSRRSCSTGCATARAMPGGRWSGSRTSSRSHGTNAEEMIIAEHQTLSSGNVTTANIVRGLRLINDVDWTVWFEKVSRVDALLREQALLCRSRFPFARPLPPRDRGSGAPLRGHRISRSPSMRSPRRTRRPRPIRDTSDIGFFLVGGRREELEAGDRLPAALRHALQARLSQGRLAGHRRPGCRHRGDPAVDDRGRARQYRPVRRGDRRHAGAARRCRRWRRASASSTRWC